MMFCFIFCAFLFVFFVGGGSAVFIGEGPGHDIAPGGFNFRGEGSCLETRDFFSSAVISFVFHPRKVRPQPHHDHDRSLA